MTKQALTFSRTDSAKFFRTLNKRVNAYFKDNIRFLYVVKLLNYNQFCNFNQT